MKKNKQKAICYLIRTRGVCRDELLRYPKAENSNSDKIYFEKFLKYLAETYLNSYSRILG